MQEFSADDTPWENYYKLGKPDLVKFAEGLGADAYSVSSPEEMKRIFAEAIESANTKHKPQVIVAFINTKEVPPWHTD
jgi:acetolactate synthase-1/2/3 large subunit